MVYAISMKYNCSIEFLYSIYLTNLDHIITRSKMVKAEKNLLSSIILNATPEPIYLNMIYIQMYRVCITDPWWTLLFYSMGPFTMLQE